MSDVIRCGKISSVNYEKGCARVTYSDKNNSVTGELPFLGLEYSMPKVGDLVYVAHRSSSLETGVILGRYWNNANKPQESGANIWMKNFGDGHLKYDSETKTLTIKAENIVLEGNVTIFGDVVVTGSITEGGA